MKIHLTKSARNAALTKQKAAERKAAKKRVGATPFAWEHFSNQLGLRADLFPIDMSQHGAAKRNAPSLVSMPVQADFAKWKNHRATPTEIAAWSQDPRYGIGINLRQLGVICIDADQRTAAKIYQEIEQLLDYIILPTRLSQGGKRAVMVFRRPAGMDLPSGEISFTGGRIRFLGVDHYMVAVGCDRRGVQYDWIYAWSMRLVWANGLPLFIPDLSDRQITQLHLILRGRRHYGWQGGLR